MQSHTNNSQSMPQTPDPAPPNAPRRSALKTRSSFAEAPKLKCAFLPSRNSKSGRSKNQLRSRRQRGRTTSSKILESVIYIYIHNYRAGYTCRLSVGWTEEAFSSNEVPMGILEKLQGVEGAMVQSLTIRGALKHCFLQDRPRFRRTRQGYTP